MEITQPIIGKVTFGGLAGFAAGFALKKIGKLLILLLGILFLILQLLAYLNYIQIDWARIQQDLGGFLTKDILDQGWQGLLTILTANLPTAGGFVVGLLIGFRMA